MAGILLGRTDADQWRSGIPLGLLDLVVLGRLMAHGLSPYTVLPWQGLHTCAPRWWPFSETGLLPGRASPRTVAEGWLGGQAKATGANLAMALSFPSSGSLDILNLEKMWKGRAPQRAKALAEEARHAGPAGIRISGHSREEPCPMFRAWHCLPDLWPPSPWGHRSSHHIVPGCARVALPVDPWHKLTFLVPCAEMRMQAWSRPSPYPPYRQPTPVFT